jgi:hypothetical protein
VSLDCSVSALWRTANHPTARTCAPIGDLRNQPEAKNQTTNKSLFSVNFFTRLCDGAPIKIVQVKREREREIKRVKSKRILKKERKKEREPEMDRTAPAGSWWSTATSGG